MYYQLTCPCCDNPPDWFPAYLSQFVVWRTTGVKPESHITNMLGSCSNCEFHYSLHRFDDDELQKLYTGYRDATYVQQRQECETEYKQELYSAEYIQQRKQFIDKLINKHAGEVNSILDYGGDDGTYIPDVPDKFVYDVSGVKPLAGVQQYDPDNHIKFDLVMNCQVLEHVSNMDQLIDRLKSLTKQYLYIEVPAYRVPPPPNMIVGEHINFFRQRSLHALLNKHNIDIVDTAVDYELKVFAVLGKI